MRKCHSWHWCGASFHVRGVCKVPSSPEYERGTPRPRPPAPLPSRCCRQRKVPVCPQSPKPWERGDAFQKDRRVLIQQDTRTYTDRTLHKSERASSSDEPHAPRSPEATAGRLGPAGPPSPGASPCCRQRPQSPPRAQRLRSRGRPRSLTSGPPRGSASFRRGRPGLRRPRWLCSKGSCLSAPAYRSRSARAPRLPPRSPLPRLPRGRPRGFSATVPRSWNRRC